MSLATDSCAIEIQQLTEVYNRRDDEPLGVRIGVSFGEAKFDDGDYYGVPPVEAARLGAGGILREVADAREALTNVAG
ncbi:MAG: hypothetical protein ACLQBB_14725 [Solirubrobacteraceae bacterium]